MNLTDAELDRYARHIVLPQVGGIGQRKLKAARVAVIGAGGIGSAVIPALAGAGIGQLTIVDSDVVEIANLHRQPLFRERDEGYAKADLALQFAHRLNRFVKAIPVQERIGPGNAERLLIDHDLVIDGSDNFATRLAVNDVCVRLGIPLLSAAAIQFQGQVGLFRSKPCYRCFVGNDPEQPEQSCADVGVVGAMAGVMGSLAAMEAIRAIVPFGEDSAGKLLLADALTLRFRTVSLSKDPECTTCRV